MRSGGRDPSAVTKLTGWPITRTQNISKPNLCQKQVRCLLRGLSRRAMPSTVKINGWWLSLEGRHSLAILSVSCLKLSMKLCASFRKSNLCRKIRPAMKRERCTRMAGTPSRHKTGSPNCSGAGFFYAQFQPKSSSMSPAPPHRPCNAPNGAY